MGSAGVGVGHTDGAGRPAEADRQARAAFSLEPFGPRTSMGTGVSRVSSMDAQV